MNDETREQLKYFHEQFKARWLKKIEFERAAAAEAQQAGTIMTAAINLVASHYKEMGATDVEVHPLIRDGRILGFGVNYVTAEGRRRAADVLLEADGRDTRETVKLFQD